MNNTLAVEAVDVSFRYETDGYLNTVLKHIDLQIAPGELVAVLGLNGCGKTTLGRLLNGLLPLQEGSLTVNGYDVRNKDTLRSLRRSVGMVFQNPDNQFVSSLAWEDLAFGLQNYQIPQTLWQERIDQALKAVHLEGFEKRLTPYLSGGQKQRLALAGVLVLNPRLLILDEVTSMLDPQGREDILTVIEGLHRAGDTAIVMITHYIEEAAMADRIILLREGSIAAQGSPREILTSERLLTDSGLLPPMTVRLYEDLKKRGILLPVCPLTKKELVNALCQLR